MIIELGHFALIVALCLAIAQAFFGLIGAQIRKGQWMTAATRAVAGQFVFTAFSFGCLVYGFAHDDFSVSYVASTSNSSLPFFYKLTAAWGAHEGSMLLWLLVLTIWSIAVAAFSKAVPEQFVSRVLGVLGLVSVGFGLFILLTSNPFERLLPAAADGRDLNPLLQDPAFAFHPPILYLGYVGMAVPFSFAIAAMLAGQMDAAWARWVRPWTTTAWMFLTVGIALGSWWAYYELGWGGWWFWDPVENSSFMPWLVGAALIHSLAVTEKRGLLKSWTLLLSIFAFSLSLLGTFLVRSGVLISVHSFAADPERGIFILSFLSLCVVGALALYAWSAPKFKSTAGFAMVSRESFLLMNNALLVVATAIVFLGTLFPIFVDFLKLPKVSVGSPWFDMMFPIPMLPLVVLLGIGMHASWKKADLSTVRRPLTLALITAVIVGVALPWLAYGSASVLTCIGVASAIWLGASALLEPIRRLRAKQTLSPGVLGMSLAHLGVASCVLGIVVAKSFTTDRDVALAPGSTATLGAYTFEMQSMRDVEGPNYSAAEATIVVTRGERQVAVLHPQKRIYRVQKNAMTEAAILPRINDIVVSLGEPLGGENGVDAWSVRLQYRPMVRFIWLGALIMAFGGLIAALDRRYRAIKTVAAKTAVDAVNAAAK